MQQAKLNDTGDLFIILDENYDKDVVISYKLDNGAEIDFVDDK